MERIRKNCARTFPSAQLSGVFVPLTGEAGVSALVSLNAQPRQSMGPNISRGLSTAAARGIVIVSERACPAKHDREASLPAPRHEYQYRCLKT
eukprot:COSAG01_NODE_2894_length_6905_cov_2.168822_8_plen_93_part_00